MISKTSVAALLALTSALSPLVSGQVFNSIYTFQFTFNGTQPEGGVIAGPGGVLYGTTYAGGTGGFNEGVVYELQPPSSAGAPWTQTVLLNFVNSNGGYPTGSLALGADGTLYGTTSGGGANSGCCAQGYGTIYQLAPPAVPGGTWTQTILHSFNVDDGQDPASGVLIGPGGGLFGTTLMGGAERHGTVFVLRPPSTPGAAWTHQVLYTFLGKPDGSSPNGLLLNGSTLYGTTQTGGVYSNQGTAFQLLPPSLPGGAWGYSSLVSFKGAGGSLPMGALALGHNGVMFGTTSYLGNYNSGTVFELVPPGTAGESWTEKAIYSFENMPQGLQPQFGVVVGPGEVLFGTTMSGGGAAMGDTGGEVFELQPPAIPGGTWTESILYSFTLGGVTGDTPAGSLLFSGGALFGVTSNLHSATYGGTVFEITP